jgi:hypothetical protein
MKYTVIEVDVDTRRPALLWARETFGMSKPEGVGFHEMRWHQRSFASVYDSNKTISRFYFKNPEDATMFALRWS